MTIQGLLFAALGFAWDKQDTRQLVTIFCVMGIIFSVSCWSSLRLSSEALHKVQSWWERHYPQDDEGPPVTYIAPTNKVLRFLRPWRLLPWVLALGWLLVLIHNITRR